MKTLITLAFLSVSTIPCFASACKVRLPKHAPTPSLNDPFIQTLQTSRDCPTDVLALTHLLKSLGLKVSSAMVANRGFHNPSQGSFSFFEEVTGARPQLPTIEPGQFFFGHFTARKSSNTIVLDQSNATNKLLVELIAWDFKKQVFNFYELMGGHPEPRWFYRGDSFDIWADNQKLYRATHPSESPFGQRLRCSACHTTGGPIMKELAAPHNDWWTTARPLWLGKLSPDVHVSERLAHLEDASSFAASVLKGIRLLLKGVGQKQRLRAQSLQETLRPLFCDQEINLVSGDQPANTRSRAGAFILIPSRIFQNPFFGESKLRLQKATSSALLQMFQMQFPETKLQDADHPWLAPVKAEADHLAITELIDLGLIDAEFAADVLAVDLTTPLFSKVRCDLLKSVPDRPFFPKWKAEFLLRLKSTQDEGAAELMSHLQSPQKNLNFHRLRAEQNLLTIQNLLDQTGGAEGVFQRLLSLRKSVREAEISKNPMGQILEPGFRVIFPESNRRQ